MTRSKLIVAGWMAALGAVVILFIDASIPRSTPSTSVCVRLWNAPTNAGFHTEVVGYPVVEISVVEISGTFSEGRYQGCFATFSGDLGEPWALYSATRIPGTETALRWRLDVAAPRWGTGFPPPRERPLPNATVQPDGHVALVEEARRG